MTVGAHTLRLTLWSIALAAVGYLGLSLWAGWREVTTALARVGLPVLAGILGLSLLNYLLRFVRWQIYLQRLGHAIPWSVSLTIYFSGFALTTTPGKIGELMRGVLLKPLGVPLIESSAAFFSERAADLLVILLLCGAVFWYYPNGTPLVIGLLFFVAACILAVQFPVWIHVVAGWTRREPARRIKRLLGHLCALVLGFGRCFHWSTLGIAIALGLIAWGAEAIAFHWLLSELGHPLHWARAVFIYSFAMLVGGVSFLPGGLGSSEAVMIALLIANGLPEATAVTATLICRLATLWFAVAIGAVFMAQRRT